MTRLFLENVLKMFSFAAALGLAGLYADTASANNVRVERDGREISIYGNNASNSIVVSQTGNRRIVIDGVGNTRVNGRNRVVINNIDLLELEIRMMGGNDQVRLSNLDVASEVSVNLGAGNDQLLSGALPCDIGVELEVIGGGGRDVVDIKDWTIDNEVSIKGNGGPLVVRMDGLIIGRELEIIGGGQNDTIEVTNSYIGTEIDVKTFRGNDNIVFENVDSGAIDVVSTTGADSVSFTQVSTALDLEVTTGGGNDMVVLDGIDVGTYSEVMLGGGNDDFIGSQVFAERELFFSGGSGFDSFTDGGIDTDGEFELFGFEVFP